MNFGKLCGIVIFSFALGACALGQRSASIPESAQSKRLKALKNQLDAKDRTLQRLKEENLALKSARPGAPRLRPILASRGPVSVGAHIDVASFEAMDEDKLYSEIVKASQVAEGDALAAAVPIYLRRFPKSIYAGDVAYRAGMYEIGQKRLAEAIQSLNVVINEYPLSDRRKDALFAKAKAYQHMNLRQQAMAAFELVGSQYPGSAESKKAAIEIEILKSEGSSSID